MHAILCATPEEMDALRGVLHADPQPDVHGPTKVWRARFGGEAIVLAQAGIGKVNAAAAATLLLSMFGARSLIFSGVAGGLNPALGVGSVLLADRLAVHDYGIISDGAFIPTAYGVIPVGAPPLIAPEPVENSVRAVLVSLAQAVSERLDARLGGVVTADYFLNCAATRDELHARLGADAIDMESGAVAVVAQAWGVPLYVIRTLSDLAGGDSHLTYDEMVEAAAVNSAACVETLLGLLAGAP
ncbi:MAG: 5'-methylthioadenosine/S-adenosylhomocysteine nucleosidase [Phenylobacterium sp.]|uniref:5'-methylthioadenosine/S-adenosylhomocysteine nucleosidase n=1 Tax=Phenylobacterium sp. TaxID=1871053 RepID=UPI0025FCA4B8|nr:5'-methylthioadenosine/S-adenosylhomocysteine nucleosidase [Phenylobacterium sp.]MBA4011645.1 5'-methylthioadenosine/S-adenosylhomocysteine nucleosidase [Phenylobacterium sp.]